MLKRSGKHVTSPRVVCAALSGLLALGCGGGSGLEPPGPPAHVQWLKANAKPFATVDPAAQDGDLAVLGPMVGTASIVGLGEASIVLRSITRMRRKVSNFSQRFWGLRPDPATFRQERVQEIFKFTSIER